MNNSSMSTVVHMHINERLPVTPVVVTLSFLSLGTVLGNSLVFTAILIKPALHSVTYLSVFSLAIADFLAGILAMPSYILKKFFMAESVDIIICDVFRFSYFLTGYASILSLSVISVERLLAVKWPLRYATVVTHERVITGLLLTWFDAIVISLLPFVPWESDSPNKECNYEPTRWWSIMVIVTNVILPFVIITTCYSYLYLTARSHIKKILSDRKSLGDTETRRPRQTNERKASTTILIVIGVFVATWFPSCLYYFLLKTCPQCFSDSFRSKQSILNAFVKILTFTSSFANPVIYCWRSRHFRRAFLEILARLSRKFSTLQRKDSNSTEVGRYRRNTITSIGKTEACNVFLSQMDEGKYIPITLNKPKTDSRRDHEVKDEQLWHVLVMKES